MTTTRTVRAETAEDQDAVRDLVAAAFGGTRVVQLLEDLRRSVAWLQLSFVAEHDHEVVGHVAFTRGWLDAPRRLVEVLVLSPLSVRPDLHRTGIGSQLVHETMQTLASRPEPLVFLEGDPGYYSRLGFAAGAELGLIPPSVRIPVPAFQVATLEGYDGSWMRGALVYPDVWWRHDAVGLRDQA